MRCAPSLSLAFAAAALVAHGAGAEGKDVVLLVDADTALFVPLGKDVDDDLAVAYAQGAPGARVASLTATFGNAGVSDTCADARRLTEALGGRWPVACGRGFRSDFREHPASAAVRQLVDVTLAAPSDAPVVWVAQGSLTNVAGALFHGGQRLVSRIDRLVLMGGSFDSTDLNTLADLSAARFVLEYPGLNRTVVTQQVAMWAVVQRVRDLGRLKACKGSFLADHMPRLEQHAFVMGLSNDRMFGPSPLGDESRLGFYPWDVVAMSAAVDGLRFFQDVRCQRLTMPGVHLEAEDADCADPAASLVPRHFQGQDFVELLVQRLCRAGAHKAGEGVGFRAGALRGALV